MKNEIVVKEEQATEVAFLAREEELNAELDTKLNAELERIKEKTLKAKNGTAIINALQANPSVFKGKIEDFVKAGLSVLYSDYYCIPYGQELNVELSYLGLQKLCVNLASNKGLSMLIKSDIINANDDFTVESVNELDEYRHKKDIINGGEMVGAYASVSLANAKGATIFRKVEFINANELKAIRANLKNDFVFNKHPSEMTKKTCVRRALKHVGVLLNNEALDKALAQDNSNYSFDKPKAQAKKVAVKKDELIELKLKLNDELSKAGFNDTQKKHFFIANELHNIDKLKALLASEDLNNVLDNYKEKK